MTKVQRDRALVREVKAGKSPDQAAAMFRLNPEYVRSICREAGISPRSLRTKRSQARRREMVERIEAGESKDAIAGEFGVSVSFVLRLLRKAGHRPLSLRSERIRKRNAEIVRRVRAGTPVRFLRRGLE